MQKKTAAAGAKLTRRRFEIFDPTKKIYTLKIAAGLSLGRAQNGLNDYRRPRITRLALIHQGLGLFR